MTNLLRRFKTTFSAELETAQTHADWARLRQRRPKLRPFESVEALLEFFSRRGGELSHYSERDLILRVLVDEYQRRGSSGRFLSGLLLRLYWPFLSRTAARIRDSSFGANIEADDLSAETVGEFLRILASINLSTNRDLNTSLCWRISGNMSDWARRENIAVLSPPRSMDADGPPRSTRTGWELDLARCAFEELHARRLITSAEHLLLIRTIVERRTLAEQTRSAANSNSNAPTYEANRKRLYRLKVRIREHLARNELTLVDLVIANLEKAANSNVPMAPSAGNKGGEELEKDTREKELEE